MRALHTYDVVPFLPKDLERLRELAFNLRWSWDVDTQALFARLDRSLWNDANRNPVRLLGELKQERLDAAARDEAFHTHFQRVCDRHDAAMQRSSWFQELRKEPGKTKIAYFSMEYGLSEALPIYSGGLGVLSGDHLKSASDLGLPLVAVGLCYQEGYFRQYLNPDGWQQERYPENDFPNMPVRPVRLDDGSQLTVTVPFPGREVHVRVWQVQVGRVPLYLLDTNTERNERRADQDLTDRLYGVGQDLRIQQELVLGVGGVRALRALGHEPTVFHMNEGHSAFLGVERIRALMEEQHLDFQTAREAAASSSVFTTHTPVPAGIDRFDARQIEEYFGHLLPRLGLDLEQFMDLGRVVPGNTEESLSMAVLALRLSSHFNGVSELHGQVSRQMWCDLWPEVPCEEVPIRGIVNGVHAATWISAEMKGLLDRYLGPRWREAPGDDAIWDQMEEIPGTELWRTHERRRERLVSFARTRLREQIERRGGSDAELALAEEVLDPEALTIGFARRFATYKRANLLLGEVDRLKRLLTDRNRPVQIIFAGKAHPADDPGKGLIQEVVELARKEEFRNRLVFLEDYDMAVGRTMVQGVDIWLNTPRVPKEASGTSGMKATMNGAIHVSTHDGWWAEAYKPDLGWTIGHGEVYDDTEYGDRVEAGELYNLLEKQIVPRFYDRAADGLPRDWIGMMKRSMRLACHRFNTSRMVRQYTVEMYMPADDRAQAMTADGFDRARKLVDWRRRIEGGWPAVEILSVEAEPGSDLQVGDQMTVSCRARLGGLSTDDVAVEVYHGATDMHGDVTGAEPVPMELVEQDGEGVAFYRASLYCSRSGRHGFSVRVYPSHDDLAQALDTRLLTWG